MEKKQLNFYKVIIASYFHDIGKMLWRGGFERIIHKSEDDYNVAHAQHLRDIIIFGKEYYELNKSRGIKTFLNSLDGNFWKDIAYIGSLHHKNDMNGKYNKVFDYIADKDEIEFRKKLVSIVYVADNVASLDRFLEENEIDEKQEKENDVSIKNKGLGSIFENIFNENELKAQNVLEPEKIEKLSSPNNDKNVDFREIALEFYNELIIFIEKNKNIETKDEFEFKKVVYNLDMICQRYFSLIPSDSFQGVTRDLSLYDHTKIVVAISSILYKKFILGEKTNLTVKTIDILNKEVSLISGDFPSIQKYIFGGITKQKQIAKRLRARSFRIQMLNEAVIEFLLEKLGYTRSNVIINAGGKFVIITDKVENEEIQKLKSNINSFFINNFNSEIKFSLVSKNKKIGEVFANNLGKEYNLDKVKQTFIELFEELSKDKFKVYDKQNLKEIFENKSVSGKKICKYCGQNYIENDEDENFNEKCDICEKEIKIGEKLVKNINNSIFINYIDDKGNFVYNEDFEKGKLEVLFNNWNYNDLNKNLGIGKSINLYVPIDKKGDTKDFETIIEDDKKDKGGLDYICMVKGDVDAMSLLFKHGFDLKGKNKTIYSVNRLTQFSRFLELFFGTYLEKKIKENFDNVYTVFSGGDDFVFIVPFGQRQKFINFLNEQFYNFVLNDKLHFSIGLGIFKDKTPFKTMDEYTEKLLKQAKKKSKEQNLDIDKKTGKVLGIKKNDGNLLAYKGITIYKQDFTKVITNEEIDFLDGVTKWDKNVKEEENIDDFYYKNGIEKENSLDIIIGDTQVYTIYSELSKAKGYLIDKKYSEFVLVGARILNMLARNKNDIKKQIAFKNIRQDIEDLIGNFDGDTDKKVEKINELLSGIVDNIYKNRYVNKK